MKCRITVEAQSAFLGSDDAWMEMAGKGPLKKTTLIEHGGTHLPSWLLEGLRQVGGKVEAGGPARRPC